MPTHKQTTVEPVATARDLGRSDSAMMKSAFPASPIHLGEITAESIQKQYQEQVIDGVVNDGGHTFGEISLDYTDSPDLNEVETGGGGLPATPYLPNPVSPGPGSLNPADQAEAPDGFGDREPNQYGEGVGSQLQPKTSSEQQSRGKLGDYVLGKSWGSGT